VGIGKIESGIEGGKFLKGWILSQFPFASSMERAVPTTISYPQYAKV